VPLVKTVNERHPVCSNDYRISPHSLLPNGGQANFPFLVSLAEPGDSVTDDSTAQHHMARHYHAAPRLTSGISLLIQIVVSTPSQTASGCSRSVYNMLNARLAT
jgi:hypothetical protein